jgi:hypothetical protein
VLKKLENTVMIGMATNNDTQIELIYQIFSFLFNMCKGLKLVLINFKYSYFQPAAVITSNASACFFPKLTTLVLRSCLKSNPILTTRG